MYGKSCVGIHSDSCDLQALQPAPLPGASGRSEYDPGFVSAGPLGLSLHHTHLLGATVDLSAGIIRAHNRIDIRLLEMPYQLLRPTVLESGLKS